MTFTTSDAFKTNRAGFRRDQAPPRAALPKGACDTHMHIVGPFATYPLRETRSLQPPEAKLEDYRNVMRTTGLQRNVIVQPSFFGQDNECTLASAEALGADVARAVVVVGTDITDSELAAMHRRGARAIRLQGVVAGGARVEDMELMADRIRLLGWHVQLYVDAKEIPALAPRIRKLPVDVVFDHMATVQRGGSEHEPGFQALLALLASGKVWVKLSGARFAPSAERARQLVQANSHRIVWGSDWPHISYEDDVPTEGALLDALNDWVPDDEVRRRILVDNASALYFW